MRVLSDSQCSDSCTGVKGSLALGTILSAACLESFWSVYSRLAGSHPEGAITTIGSRDNEGQSDSVCRRVKELGVGEEVREIRGWQ